MPVCPPEAPQPARRPGSGSSPRARCSGCRASDAAPVPQASATGQPRRFLRNPNRVIHRVSGQGLASARTASTIPPGGFWPVRWFSPYGPAPWRAAAVWHVPWTLRQAASHSLAAWPSESGTQPSVGSTARTRHHRRTGINSANEVDPCPSRRSSPRIPRIGRYELFSRLGSGHHGPVKVIPAESPTQLGAALSSHEERVQVPHRFRRTRLARPGCGDRLPTGCTRWDARRRGRHATTP